MSEFPKVHVIAGEYAVMPWVHAYVIEGENSSFIVDATYTLSSATALRELADSLGKPIEAIVITHGHPDHYTGLVKFHDIPMLSTRGVLEFTHREDIAKGEKSKGFLGDEYPDERVFPNEMVKDGDTFNFAGVKVTHTDLGPNESDSDSIWTYEKDGTTVAFLGDLVAPTHCFLRDGHTHEWLETLARLDKQFGDDTIIYQGHATTPSTKAVINWQAGYIKAYHAFIDQLEDRTVPPSQETKDQLLAALNTYHPVKDQQNNSFLPTFEMDIYMAEIYKQRPYVPA